MSTSLLPLIEKKKSKLPLTKKEIQSWVDSLSSKKSPPDYQVASLLAFIYFNGMNAEETAALTQAMRFSGAQFKYKGFPRAAKFVDKHSTGGVGDKITLPLGAIVAACDEKVYYPTITGRGLGHTGGTVDKFESIPGFNCGVSLAKFYSILKKHHVCFMSQTKDITPADRFLYHLRDATGTVESIPLITASILSKKLSETLDYLLLDVKYGSGAFLPSQNQIEDLSESLLGVLSHDKLNASICVTNMETPLGHYSGNRLEVQESLDILQGKGPKDSTELTKEFAVRMLEGVGHTLHKARDLVDFVIESGKAYELFDKVVTAQGGSLAEFAKVGKKTKVSTTSIKASNTGYLKFDVRKLGLSLVELGGGRKTKEDKVDVHVGFYHPHQTGDKVQKGQEILKIYYRDKKKLTSCKKMLKSAIKIQEERFSKPTLIRKILTTAN
jgi:pyrimidine-nucleoside phosphorylase